MFITCAPWSAMSLRTNSSRNSNVRRDWVENKGDNTGDDEVECGIIVH